MLLIFPHCHDTVSGKKNNLKKNNTSPTISKTKLKSLNIQNFQSDWESKDEAAGEQWKTILLVHFVLL